MTKPAKETILIVEDDSGVALLERRCLERAGYEAVSVTNPGEALEKVKQGDIELIVLDLGLPGESGLEFYERLKVTGYDLPVIVVTGLSDELTIIQALRAGVRDFVTKSPEYLDYLPEAVERALRQTHLEQSLQESEEKYRSIFENSIEGIYQASLDGRLLTANPAMARMFGYGSPEEMISAGSDTTTQLWVSAEERAGYVRQLQEEGDIAGMETRMKRKDGIMIWVSANIRALRNSDGDMAALEGTLEDISERKRAEDALRESEARHFAVVDSAFDPIITMTSAGNIEAFNEAAENVFGYKKEEIVGQQVTMLMPERFRELHRAGLSRYIRTGVSRLVGQRRIELVGRRKDGEEFPLELSLSEVLGSGNPLFTAVLRDITERKRAEERLRHQAFHDSLTELPNRQLFVDRLEQALARAERRESEIAVFFMDLDYFKLINDSLGHEAGDRLLLAVGERLRTCLRSEDTIARFGGDEFAVLLEVVASPSFVAQVADRIAKELEEPFILDGRQVFVTASIGIALDVSGRELPEELLRNADVAMFKAKGNGNCRYQVFDQSMHDQALRRLELENDLRRALEREEFIVYYQPKVSLELGKVCGFEALVRWKHPQRGLISPAEFIPLAEETGLMVPIGRWVLREACRQAKEWQTRHQTNDARLTVSVNLSPRQFHQTGLVESVAQVLEETGLDSCSLALEITESAVMQNAQLARTILQRLKDSGVRIEIDDFGTGYSSLSRLKHLPIDVLKIDRSFVLGLGEYDEDEHIVSSIINLAFGLGLSVVAEGVETPEQAARLRTLGCEIAQGYYFSKPLSSEALDALLTSQFANE